MNRFFALATCAICFAAPNVRADEPVKPAEPTIVIERSWYGWQTMTCDWLVLTSFIIGGETARQGTLQEPYPNYFGMNRPFAVSGAAIFLAGGPLVHLAHGHVARALGDLTMRALMGGVPLLTAVGLSKANDGVENGIAFLLLPIVVLNGIAAVAVDAASLSREEKPVVLEKHASQSPVILPDFSVHQGGGTLGIQGAF